MEPQASVGSIQVASLDVFLEECQNDEAQKFVKDGIPARVILGGISKDSPIRKRVLTCIFIGQWCGIIPKEKVIFRKPRHEAAVKHS